MANAILLDGKDNVATCTAAARSGETIKILGGGEIVCVEDIPIWHKVALKKISAGGWVSHENIFSVPRDYKSEMI